MKTAIIEKNSPFELIMPMQVIRQKIAHIPNVDFDTSPAALAQSVRKLKDIPVCRTHKILGAYLSCHSQDLVTRAAVLQAYTKSISTIWIVMTPVVGISFIMGESGIHIFDWGAVTDETLNVVLFIKAYTLKRTIVRAGDPAAAKQDTEKGTSIEQDRSEKEEDSEKSEGEDIYSRSNEKEIAQTAEGDASDDVTVRPTTAESKSADP